MEKRNVFVDKNSYTSGIKNLKTDYKRLNLIQVSDYMEDICKLLQANLDLHVDNDMDER